MLYLRSYTYTYTYTYTYAFALSLYTILKWPPADSLCAEFPSKHS
ncbi:hypothetical protein [Pontibacter amylolyticus]|nr:hypothetical protein [Pontibacter amylolyticus]